MRHLPLSLLGWSIASLSLWANPTGGVVANGSASVTGQGTSSLIITQGSDKAIINWQTFSIGSGELTKFVQPSSSSAALNRVLGGQTSIINGTLSANGQIFLINGNGILVGPGGVINTAGFTGSTRDISDSDFMSGNLHFVGNSDAGVKNFGTITALGGDVVLIGKTVDNEGLIRASGTAALAAGDDVLLAQKNADGSTVTVNPVSSPTATKKKVGVKNKGVIEASTAELKAANGNIYALAIQNEGMVQATTVAHQGGHIYLTSDSGTIVNSGTLDASATAAGGAGGTILVKSTAGKVVHSGKLLARGGAGGTGGNAEISGAVVTFTGTVDLRADGGKTGTLLLDPDSVVVNGTGTGTNPGITYLSNTSVDSSLGDADFVLNADNNIAINADIDWTSGTTLTLSTNNTGSAIQINAAINGTSDGTASGTPNGSLVIAGGTGSVISTSMAGTVNVQNFNLQSGSWVQLINVNGNGGNLPETYDINGNPLSILPTFNVTGDFEIGNTAAFLRADSGNGTTIYYGLQDIYGVQGMNGYLNSNFTLNGREISAGVTANWNPMLDDNENTVYQGFEPIGINSESGYSGSFFNGSIDNLTIYQPNAGGVGLFSSLTNTGAIQNVSLNYASITGGTYVGGFVGSNYGQIDGVSFFDGSVTGTSQVGGIVGYQAGGYLGDGSYQIHTAGSSVGYATITGQSYVGGAVGENAGQVNGVSVYGFTGGDSGATVTGNTYVGGVVGSNDYVSDTEDYPVATITNASFNATLMNDDTAGVSSKLGGIAGENDGIIQNSNTFATAIVQGDEQVGGVVGFNTGMVRDSFNLGAVSGVTNNQYDGTNAYIGGVAGENGAYSSPYYYSTDSISSFAVGNQPILQYGTVQTSYNAGTVTGGSYVGGISGSNDYAQNLATTVYNVGTISGSSYVGGLVGDNYGTVNYSYDSGAVSGMDASTTGALIGDNETGGLNNLSYWDATTSATSDANLGAIGTNNGTAYVLPVSPLDNSAYSDSQDGNIGDGYSFFGYASPVAGTNGVDTIGTSPDDNSSPAWYILPGNTRPILAMEFTGNVGSPHALQLIATDLTGNFYVAQNIDLTTTNDLHDIWSSAGFAPIGGNPNLEQTPFSGLFYGNGYTISNLFINRPSTDDVGLFGYVASGATVQSFTLSGVTVTGASNTGGVAGVNAGTLSSVTVQFIPSDDITGTSAVGGVAGTNFGTMTFDSNSVGVSGNTNVGGIAGLNDTDGGSTAGFVGESFNTGTINGIGNSSAHIGGVVGLNVGAVTQSYNLGDVSGATASDVGGLVGWNYGQVDDSYSGGGSQSGTISGAQNVGGLVGLNYLSATLETSYNTSQVQSPLGLGELVGLNYGTLMHSYWDTDNAAVNSAAGAGNTGTDAVGYSTAQLTDARNFAQGASPGLWNFSPQGTAPGVWGINVYNSYNGQVNDGLPVLQWQTPVNVKIAATNGQQNYGYAPTYTATGSGVSQLNVALGNGPVFNVNYGTQAGSAHQAGDTDTLTVSGQPSTQAGSFNIEYVNGTVNIVPAPLYITANSYTVPVGGAYPAFGATYTGLQNGDLPSSLSGTLQFNSTAADTTLAGLYAIGVYGQSALNYAITYIPGTLNIYPTGSSAPPPATQLVKTFQAEATTIQNFFANDPSNGLFPLYFAVIPNQFGLSGELLGAVNNEPDATDYAYGSSTSNLPAAYRMVTPGTGVVEVIDGVVVAGGQMPKQAVEELDGVLSQSSIAQLAPLTNGLY